LESIKTITSGLKALPLAFSASKHTPGPSLPSQSRSTATTYGSFVGHNSPQMIPGIQNMTPWPSTAYPPTDFPHSAFPPPTVELGTAPVIESITWSSFDTAVTEHGITKLVLLAYSSALQIWDITSLDSMKEILNVDVMSLISSPGAWVLSEALILPPPPATAKDQFAHARPLLAIM